MEEHTHRRFKPCKQVFGSIGQCRTDKRRYESEERALHAIEVSHRLRNKKKAKNRRARKEAQRKSNHESRAYYC